MILNIKDQKFEKLKVIDFAYIKDSQSYWECLCECGNKKIICGKILKRGLKSCGCLRNLPSRTWKGYEDISGAYWYSIKDGAKKRNIFFNLSIEDAWNLFEKQQRKCSISGVDLKFVRKYSTKDRYEQTASLDRINSDKDYTLDNIHWVHKIINQMKWDMNLLEFKNWCYMIAENNKKITGII